MAHSPRMSGVRSNSGHSLNLKIHEGVLFKRGKINKRLKAYSKKWKEKWFILTSDLVLRYYESQSKALESEMENNDQLVLGAFSVLDIERIEVANVSSGFGGHSNVPR